MEHLIDYWCANIHEANVQIQNEGYPIIKFDLFATNSEYISAKISTTYYMSLDLP